MDGQELHTYLFRRPDVPELHRLYEQPCLSLGAGCRGLGEQLLVITHCLQRWQRGRMVPALFILIF
jgi:hypothetical protein